jgi:hypothetical protein
VVRKIVCIVKTGPVESVEELDQRLSEPNENVIETFRRLDGDMIFLGAGGKMGPTLARMAKRASDAAGKPRRIFAVSRFSSSDQAAQFETHGIETIRCDLLDEAAIARLPEVPNVMFMTGMKFGSTGQESTTWAMNAYLPALVCKKFSSSRIAAFSSGNIYGLTAVSGGGSVESDRLEPVGEYAMSCVGRERMFDYFSRSLNIPMALIRLNYACELRYGVLVDLAHKVWAEETIDLSMGFFNIIWQGDANAMALQVFDHLAAPPFVINTTGPELLRVRDVCEEFGWLLKKEVSFAGHEAPSALLSNASRAFELFGKPRVTAARLMQWIADWIQRGGATHGKPTHFESRDGKF